ncbi:SGNH/GDSL hydrolase family protein [Rufibacter ruber]|uniref:SGNH/GDSL hydrolase family protein n=1 Tax=Rufibacter ruber TaxID=1783499 RepID=UPI00082F0920|nr:SGNH/GDSL hydrolase family protein [Rufibacter ruber]
MKNILHKIGTAVILSSAFFFAGCEPEFEEKEITVSAGPLDLSKYVAIGNSLTAGFQDGGLYLEGQVNSYPNILAYQFSYAGGGQFVQPLFSNEQFNGSGYLRLTGFTTSGSPIIAPVTTSLAVRTDAAALPGGPRLAKFANPATIQNWGVPGISVLSSSQAAYGGINPYYERLLTDAEVGQVPYVQKVLSTKPTFFSLWLGNNDVLTYATNGAVVDPNNPFSGLTDPTTFRAIYTQLVTGLVQGGTEGVIANIPDVTAVPYFTTVTQDMVRRSAGNNQLVIYIRTGEGQADVRPIEAGDYILLTTQAAIGRADNFNGTTIPHGFHPLNPLTDKEVLDKAEVEEVRGRTIALNQIIKEVATANKIPVFDTFDFFNKRKSGFMQNGIGYSAAFITGNLFSLDGIHLTPRGYAIVANEFINTINSHYKSTIPTIDVTQFRTVLIP